MARVLDPLDLSADARCLLQALCQDGMAPKTGGGGVPSHLQVLRGTFGPESHGGFHVPFSLGGWGSRIRVFWVLGSFEWYQSQENVA